MFFEFCRTGLSESGQFACTCTHTHTHTPMNGDCVFVFVPSSCLSLVAAAAAVASLSLINGESINAEQRNATRLYYENALNEDNKNGRRIDKGKERQRERHGKIDMSSQLLGCAHTFKNQAKHKFYPSVYLYMMIIIIMSILLFNAMIKIAMGEGQSKR